MQINTSHLVHRFVFVAIGIALTVPLAACNQQESNTGKAMRETRMATHADTVTATATDMTIQQAVMYMTGHILPIESLRDIQSMLVSESMSFETFATELMQTKQSREWFLTLLLVASHQQVPTEQQLETWLAFYENELQGDMLALITNLLDDPADLTLARVQGLSNAEIIRSMATSLSQVFLFFTDDHDHLAASISPAVMADLSKMAEENAPYLSVRVLLAVMPEIEAQIDAWTANAAAADGLALVRSFTIQPNFSRSVRGAITIVRRGGGGGSRGGRTIHMPFPSSKPALTPSCPPNAYCAMKINGGTTPLPSAPIPPLGGGCVTAGYLALYDAAYAGGGSCSVVSNPSSPTWPPASPSSPKVCLTSGLYAAGDCVVDLLKRATPNIDKLRQFVADAISTAAASGPQPTASDEPVPNDDDLSESDEPTSAPSDEADPGYSGDSED